MVAKLKGETVSITTRFDTITYCSVLVATYATSLISLKSLPLISVPLCRYGSRTVPFGGWTTRQIPLKAFRLPVKYCTHTDYSSNTVHIPTTRQILYTYRLNSCMLIYLQIFIRTSCKSTYVACFQQISNNSSDVIHTVHMSK